MKYKEILERPFYLSGRWIAERLVNKESAKYQKTERMLEFTEGEQTESNVLDFTAKKIAKILMVLFLGTGLCLLLAAFGENQGEILMLTRPSYGQGSMETNLTVQIEGETGEKKIPITLQERKYRDQEIEDFFQNAIENMESIILEENISMNEVRTELKFPVSLENGAVKAEWITSQMDLIDDTGKIIREADENGEMVEITVNLSCQGKTIEHSFFIRVYPKVRSEEEMLIKKIEDSVKKEDGVSAEKEQMKLPGKIGEKQLTWKESKDSLIPIIFMLVILTAVCMALLEEEKVQKAVREKRIGLMMDYASFLYKLTSLLRAGLTIRGAFEKIADTKQVRKHYVDEEVRRCCNEMKSGIAEAQAYENFGRRCQISEYIKIGTILAQNLRKGSDGLADLLEGEALRGMEERQKLARKLGEQAGTRLLFPMMLMLVVVVVILMAPAFLTFSAG